MNQKLVTRPLQCQRKDDCGIDLQVRGVISNHKCSFEEIQKHKALKNIIEDRKDRKRQKDSNKLTE